MDQPNAVDIVEDCVVAPPPAATPDQSSTTPPNPLPLTFFDIFLIQIKEPPIQCVYFLLVYFKNMKQRKEFRRQRKQKTEYGFEACINTFL